MKKPTPQTIATVARYIAALRQDAQAHLDLAHALQPFHDTLIQLADTPTSDSPTYQQLKFGLADVVTAIIDANHVITATNDELRRATLEYAIAMENIGPHTPHPRTLA
jgi:hypothetical protein